MIWRSGDPAIGSQTVLLHVNLDKRRSVAESTGPMFG